MNAKVKASARKGPAKAALPRVLANKKPLLTIKTMELNVLEMANASCMSFTHLMKELKDGRVSSRYTEHWSAQVFGFEKHSNTNTKDSDGVFVGTADQMEAFVSVKCLTNCGVKFQNSKDVGAGRSCDKEKLLAAINATQKIMIVDIMNIPEVRLIPLDSAMVARWVKSGQLGTSGVKASSLQKLLEKSFETIVEESVDMALWQTGLAEQNKAEAEQFYAERALKKALATKK